MPDDPGEPTGGNPRNLAAASELYQEAREIFTAAGEVEKARIVAEAMDQIERERLAATFAPHERRQA